MLPTRIRFYMIRSLKESDVGVVDFKKFKFGTKSFNLYDPHGLCRDPYARVYCSWINGACNWPMEDPWRYCYNSSRLKEPVKIVVQFLATLKVEAP